MSICNIPNVERTLPAEPSLPSGETEGECDPYHIRCIEQILNDADVRDSNSSFSKPPEPAAVNPTHFKAYSEDLGEGKSGPRPSSQAGATAATAAGGSRAGGDKPAPKSIWLPSPSTFPLFFYQPSKSPDKMEVVAEQLNENLHLDGDSSSPPNI